MYRPIQEEPLNYATSAFQRVNTTSRNPGKTTSLVPLTQITRTIYAHELEFRFDLSLHVEAKAHYGGEGGGLTPTPWPLTSHSEDNYVRSFFLHSETHSGVVGT